MIDSVSDVASAAADLKKARRRKNTSSDSLKLDRLPPHALDMEQGVLGCQLLSPNECIGEVIEKLKSVGAEAHYDLRHQTIQTELFEMYDNRVPIEIVTVMQRLKDKGLLDQIGGISYLAQLQDSVPSAANLSYYLEIVQENFLLRRMIAVCTEVVGRVYDYDGNAEALLDEVEKEILSIRPKDSVETNDIKTVVQKVIDDIESRHLNGGKISGLSTGLPDLDSLTDGLQNGELTILTAFDAQKKDSSSLGKTAMAMGIVEHVIVELKLPVGVFSLEMTAHQIAKRFISSIGKVNLRMMNRGTLYEGDFPKITMAAGKLSRSLLYLDDSSDLNVMQIKARARRMKQQYGIRFLVIDYLQLITDSGGKNDNEEKRISDMARGLHALAKELNIPVMVLSQTNEDGKIRGSRAVRHHSENHFIIKPVEDQADDADAVQVKLWIDKARNAPAGSHVDLVFIRSMTRFESASRISDADLPHND